MKDLNELPVEKWLELNAKLQSKKSALRKGLATRGILKRGGHNDYDNYTYFSEAQYKLLFTEFLPQYGLELTSSTRLLEMFEGSSKQSNGRLARMVFVLTDTETGFYEEAEITGEGMDKGDKAGYKAYTGALKYYLADTFLVATGDDAEKESPAEVVTEKKASPAQIAILAKRYTGDNLTRLLETNGVARIEDISMTKASELISKLPNRQPARNVGDVMALINVTGEGE